MVLVEVHDASNYSLHFFFIVLLHLEQRVVEVGDPRDLREQDDGDGLIGIEEATGQGVGRGCGRDAEDVLVPRDVGDEEFLLHKNIFVSLITVRGGLGGGSGARMF